MHRFVRLDDYKFHSSGSRLCASSGQPSSSCILFSSTASAHSDRTKHTYFSKISAQLTNYREQVAAHEPFGGLRPHWHWRQALNMWFEIQCGCVKINICSLSILRLHSNGGHCDRIGSKWTDQLTFKSQRITNGLTTNAREHLARTKDKCYVQTWVIMLCVPCAASKVSPVCTKLYNTFDNLKPKQTHWRIDGRNFERCEKREDVWGSKRIENEHLRQKNKSLKFRYCVFECFFNGSERSFDMLAGQNDVAVWHSVWVCADARMNTIEKQQTCTWHLAIVLIAQLENSNQEQMRKQLLPIHQLIYCLTMMTSAEKMTNDKRKLSKNVWDNVTAEKAKPTGHVIGWRIRRKWSEANKERDFGFLFYSDHSELKDSASPVSTFPKEPWNNFI